MKHIKDSLYDDYISISEEEREVLDSPSVQRLRRVNQLGLSSVVYPGATHTRFEHSLGVMHLAGKMARSLGLNEEEIRDYRLGGLLHDVGHGPFSHASESIIKKETGKAHEDFSEEIVDDLSDVLPTDANKIKKIIRGESQYNIVNGTIDVDRMDYLRRDAVNTNIEHGSIDYNTIIQFSELNSGNLVFDQKATQALENLLMARFHMHQSVYGHHTSIIAEKMLEEALKHYLEQNTVESIVSLDDYELHTLLSNEKGISGQLYRKIRNRELYKTAYHWNIGREFSSSEIRKIMRKVSEETLQTEISEKSSLPQHKVVITLPSIPNDSPMEIPILTENGQLKDLQEYSPVPGNLMEYEWSNLTIGVYAPSTHRDKVGDVSEEVLEEKFY